MDDDRIAQAVSQTREELIEIKASQRRLEEIMNNSTKRLEKDIGNLQTKFEKNGDINHKVQDHEVRLGRIESAFWKVVMAVIVAFVGALIALVLKK